MLTTFAWEHKDFSELEEVLSTGSQGIGVDLKELAAFFETGVYSQAQPKLQGSPKKVSHYQVSSLNRIKNRY